MRGVVPVESPASWPIEALKAQAVAARTYAITTSKGGDGFDQYPDTRSQVYGGVGAETPATDEAVAETAGQVVTYGGEPVVTYFFSTSGGRTEDVENSLGGEPRAVAAVGRRSLRRRLAAPPLGPDPHVAGVGRRPAERAGQGLLPRHQGGQPRPSPRVIAAEVIGTRGRTRVSGATLRARFGLYDTWAYYSSIATRKAPAARRGAGRAAARARGRRRAPAAPRPAAA